MSKTRPNLQSDAEPPDSLLLPGLDGANPLGFLAALGLFRVLDQGGLRMSWASSGGTWVPALHPSAGETLEEDRLVTTLSYRLATSIDTHAAHLIIELGEVADHEDRRRQLFIDIASGTDRGRMDWTAALASDFAPAASINQLQTTRRDYFLGNVISVVTRTNGEHLRRAIFHAWDYADALDNQSLHLDPSEDRRHAHQWNKPAGDPDRKTHGGMLGANRLALEAIPLFSSFPEGETLRTLGFTGSRSTDTRWTWPLWGVGLSLPTVRSLLASETLQKGSLNDSDVAALRAQGVVAVYRTYRILVQKTPNFTPVQCLV
jgi:CRISPR-associated endonuclease/helicase Cas3